MCQSYFNPYRQTTPQWDNQHNSAFESTDILHVHRSLDEYSPTPLISLPSLANQLSVRRILVKDESRRFGLKAFKALGATYAIYRFLQDHVTDDSGYFPDAREFYRNTDAIQPGMFTFCTATDGNHGRAVAWVARKLRQQAVIYIPRGTARARIDNIAVEGAQVEIVNGSYDDAVARVAVDAQKNGWQIISDTSWPGYTEIPRWIMAGYTTLFKEIHEVQGAEEVDMVFVQAGVGSLAAAAAWYYNKASGAPRAKLIAVEPTEADCLLESIQSVNGNPNPSKGRLNSLMAGLNCGIPSLVAWPYVKLGFDLFITVSDDSCINAMRLYYYPHKNDSRIVSGESGAAGLAAFMNLCENESLVAARKALGITSDSTVLLINTEGDTDPVHFNKVIAIEPQ